MSESSQSDIAKAEKTKHRRTQIRYPKWYRVARSIRSSLVPAQYRVVFDMECDPSYKDTPIAEKAVIANEIATARYEAAKASAERRQRKTPLPEFTPVTEELYEEAKVFINSSHQVREARTRIYQNLRLADALLKDFDAIVDKAVKHADPGKILAISKEVRAANRDYAIMYEDRLDRIARNYDKRLARERKEKAQGNVSLPNYTKAEVRSEE